MEMTAPEKLFELVSKTGSLISMAEAAKRLLEPTRSQELIKILGAIQSDEKPSLEGKYRFNVMLGVAKEVGEPQRTEELLKIFTKESIDSSHRARQAAKLMSEPKRSELLNQILALHVSRGDYNEAEKTAGNLGQSLTESQVESMLSGHIKSGCYQAAVDLALMLGRKLSTAELSVVFERMKEYVGVAGYQLVEIAKQFSEPQRKQELTKLLADFLVGTGDLDSALSVVKALGRRLLPAELDQLMEYWIKHYQYNRVCELEDRLKRLGYKRILTSAELEKLLQRQISQGWAWDDKITSRLGRTFTVEELQTMIDLQANAGNLGSASAIAKKLSEPKRTEELEKILKMQTEQAELKGAIDTAVILGRSLTTAELMIVLEKQISEGATEDAKKTAEMLLKIQ